MKYYYRRAVLELGVPAVSLDRFSRLFRGTDFVLKLPGRRFMYSEYFVAFCLARKGQTGPANLPTPRKIALLYTWINQGKTVDEIAAVLQSHPLIIQDELKQLGLEVKHDYNEEAAVVAA